MSITPEVSAKTLTQLVATEIKVQMARADVRQSQLAREVGKNEQWLSVRLRGLQPIDMNDLALIAHALGVGVHQLLPPPEIASTALVTDPKPFVSIRPGLIPAPLRHRPSRHIKSHNGRSDSRRPETPRRTARLPRPDLS